MWINQLNQGVEEMIESLRTSKVDKSVALADSIEAMYHNGELQSYYPAFRPEPRLINKALSDALGPASSVAKGIRSLGKAIHRALDIDPHDTDGEREQAERALEEVAAGRPVSLAGVMINPVARFKDLVGQNFGAGHIADLYEGAKPYLAIAPTIRNMAVMMSVETAFWHSEKGSLLGAVVSTNARLDTLLDSRADLLKTLPIDHRAQLEEIILTDSLEAADSKPEPTKDNLKSSPRIQNMTDTTDALERQSRIVFLSSGKQPQPTKDPRGLREVEKQQGNPQL